MPEQNVKTKSLGVNDYIQIKKAENGWVAVVQLFGRPGLSQRRTFIAPAFGELCEHLECFLAEEA